MIFPPDTKPVFSNKKTTTLVNPDGLIITVWSKDVKEMEALGYTQVDVLPETPSPPRADLLFGVSPSGTLEDLKSKFIHGDYTEAQLADVLNGRELGKMRSSELKKVQQALSVVK